jgi:predicted DCC family thiol-disulfide oxidoreductase YuxK
MGDSAVLLFDGACGFCADSVRFVLQRDRRGTLRFAPLESDFGRGVLARHEGLRTVDSIIWVDAPSGTGPERVFTHSTAALRVMQYLGGTWNLARLATIIPAPIRDAVYRFIARHRHRLSSGGPQCLVPTAEERARFLA